MKKIFLLMAACALFMSGCSSVQESSSKGKPVLDAKTYEGSGLGRNGNVTVEVTCDESGITAIEVKEHAETYGVAYGMETTPFEALTKQIIETQSLNVDTIGGATLSSNALINAVKDALTKGEVDLSLFDKEIAKGEIETEYSTDVVVVGGGVAGLSAAISAADNGASVLLLEKEGITGGSTTVSGGKILAAGTELQAQQGIEDSAEALIEYMLSLGNQGDEEAVRFFAENSAGAVTFMLDNGVEFGDVERTHISIPTWRVHNDKGSGWMLNGKGGEIIVAMTESAVNKGVQIVYNTPAYELIEENGVIVGVKARCEDTEVVVHAKAVILASGGYSHNEEMMNVANERSGLSGGVPTSSGVGNTGDGILMAEAVGAEVDYSVGGQYTYIDFKSGVGIQEEAGLIVSENGERVHNEYSYQYAMTSALVSHGSSIAYYITDADDPNKTVQYALTLDSTFKAESVEELAELIGVDQDTLVATLDRYNKSCQNGEDEEFGKPAEFLNEITGTIYAIKMNRSNSLTYGGVKTNLNAEVVDESGNSIPGLYAAGEVAFYTLLGTEPDINYPSCGTAVANGVIFGQVAGKNAAAK